MSTHSTRPSSQTRLVDANWNASAEAADAPFWNRLLPMAMAAYEHDEEAAPSPVAVAMGFKPPPERAFWMRSRGTHAWTTAEMKKPKTSAHQTSQPIRNASRSPCQMTSSTELIAGIPRSYQSPYHTLWGYMVGFTNEP